MKTPSLPPTGWSTSPLTTVLPLVAIALLGSALAFVGASVSLRPVAGPLAAGIAALDANDYARARQVFQTLADKKDTAAELWLAHLYQDGLGVPPNAQQAVMLLTKAADAGSARAAAQLGALYLDGNGILQDVGKAQQWLSRAAQQGDAAAQRELGLLYEEGLGTAKDPRQAYVWLDIAARDGDAQAPELRDRVLATLTPAEAAAATAAAQDKERLLTSSAAHSPPAPAAAAPAPQAVPGAKRS